MRNILLLLVCLFFVSATKAQDSTLTDARNAKNEVDVDVTSILTFLKKDVQSYAIYYRRSITPQLRLRTALNFAFSDDSDKGRYADLSLGIDKSIVKASTYKVYYGTDLFGSYSKGNFQPNKNYKVGAGLFIGASYFLSKRLSISTEPRLNFTYFIYRNPTSFDPSANKETYEIGLGTIGLLIIGFHF